MPLPRLHPRHLIFALLLAMPALGVWLFLAGLYQGPNYFAWRLVVIEDAVSTTSTSQAMRGGAAGSTTVWHLRYRYRDAGDRPRTGNYGYRPEELPPPSPQPGQQLLLRIPVDAGEGSFALNRQADGGLGIALVFGLMAWLAFPAVLRPSPAARIRWHLGFGAFVGLTALIAFSV